MESILNNIYRFAAVLTNLFAFSGLAFRSTIYPHLPVSLGEAYGVGDIIDLLFWLLIVVCWMLTVVSSTIACLFWFKVSAKQVSMATTMASVALVGYYYVHG